MTQKAFDCGWQAKLNSKDAIKKQLSKYNQLNNMLSENNYRNKFFDAIILSSTFNEEILQIEHFIKHLCSKSKDVKVFSVTPVIVFENRRRKAIN